MCQLRHFQDANGSVRPQREAVGELQCPDEGARGGGGRLLFHKAVDMQLVQVLVGCFKPLGKVCNMLLIVLLLVSFLGFPNHCAMIGMPLFKVIFSIVPATIDSLLQPHGPLEISVVGDWVEDLVSVMVCRLR